LWVQHFNRHIQPAKMISSAFGQRDYLPITGLPYTAFLPSGHMTVGSTLVVQGKIENNFGSLNSRFAINLKTGAGAADNIALHFNPRHDVKQVAINTLVDNKWGNEEQEPLPHDKLKTNMPFEFKFVAGPNEMEIHLNGVMFHRYRHRMSPDNIRAINITADNNCITLKQIEFLSGGGGGGGHGGGSRGTQMPYTRSYRPQAGQGIDMSWTPTSPNDRFEVNLKSRGDIAMHLNIRLDERDIVRNSLNNGQWANEERNTPSFPFSMGKTTQVYVMPTPNGFNVALDGTHAIEFRHRMPMHSIDSIEIKGDGQLNNVLM